MKNQEGGLFSILLGTLGGSMLGNLFTKKVYWRREEDINNNMDPMHKKF